jgi:hypothetical protein
MHRGYAMLDRASDRMCCGNGFVFNHRLAAYANSPTLVTQASIQYAYPASVCGDIRRKRKLWAKWARRRRENI